MKVQRDDFEGQIEDLEDQLEVLEDQVEVLEGQVASLEVKLTQQAANLHEIERILLELTSRPCAC